MLRKLAEMTILVLSFSISIILRLIDPSSRGFFCDDTTIRYPYTHNTVPSVGLFLVTIVFDLAVVAATEYYFFRRDSAPDRHSYWSTAYDMFMCYLFGYACCLALTSAAKMTIGRLRPHFLAVCRPDWSKVKCGNFTYLEPDVVRCTSLDAKAVRQARMSFPSGHASLSFYAATFLVLYVNLKIEETKNLTTLLIKYGAQFTLITAASCVSLSRITDNAHHWSDVLVGAIAGISVATTFIRLCFTVLTAIFTAHCQSFTVSFSCRRRIQGVGLSCFAGGMGMVGLGSGALGGYGMGAKDSSFGYGLFWARRTVCRLWAALIYYGPMVFMFFRTLLYLVD